MCNHSHIFLGLESQQSVAVFVFSGVYQWSLVRFLAKFCTVLRRASVGYRFCLHTFIDESHFQ
jgi:hypothetical protein